MLKLGSEFPKFTVKSNFGEIKLPDYFGDKWGIIFTHPADFTPVCTTEFARTVKLIPKFTEANVMVLGISCDTVESHKEWQKDIQHVAGAGESSPFPFAIVADHDRKIVTELGMLDPSICTASGLPLPARAVCIIDPAKKVRAGILYPASSGRNFDEILRLVTSIQLTHKTGLFTPVDWIPGKEVIVPPNMSADEVKTRFKTGVFTKDLPSNKEYLRYTADPIDP